MGEFDWDAFIDNLWERENAQGKRGIEGKGGYRNGKYYPYKTANGNVDIGPGFDIEHQSTEFKERAKKGFTKKELDSIVRSRLKDEIHYFNQKIATEGGDTTNVPNNIYAGLLDMQWQVGNGLYRDFPKFWKAVANRDYDGMRRESEVTYIDPNGNRHVDTGRRDFRNQTYFNGPSKPNIKPLFPSHTEVPDALRVASPYPTQVDNTLLTPTMVPDEDRYVTTHPLTEVEDRVNKFKKAVKNKQEYDNMMKSISLQNNETPKFEPKLPFAEGGYLQPKDAWDTLSIAEKAEMMKVAVRNGIYNLKDIRAKYNEFAEGGDTQTDRNYDSWKKQLAAYKGINVDEDNTYDYEGFFYKYPQEAWAMFKDDPDAHFSDEFKTVYHPTFSAASQNNDGSIYSGVKHPIFNPEGLKGGTWSPDYKSFTMSVDGYKGPVSMDERKWYLENAEDGGVQLREADGSLPVYDGISWGGVLPNVTIFGNRHSSGGRIHIKPSHRGRLTELKKRTGKTEAELYRTGSAATRKMITFARNARKWKHGEGGPLIENIFDGETEDSQQMQTGNGHAIYLNYPNLTGGTGGTIRIGGFDLGRAFSKVTGINKLPVGHAGVIMIDEDGNSTYYDYGRFNKGTDKYGVSTFGAERPQGGNWRKKTLPKQKPGENDSVYVARIQGGLPDTQYGAYQALSFPNIDVKAAVESINKKANDPKRKRYGVGNTCADNASAAIVPFLQDPDLIEKRIGFSPEEYNTEGYSIPAQLWSLMPLTAGNTAGKMRKLADKTYIMNQKK